MDDQDQAPAWRQKNPKSPEPEQRPTVVEARDVTPASPRGPPRLIKRAEVLRRIAKSKSWLYPAVAAGEFPAPVETGPNSVAWIEDEVSGWIQQRIAARDARGLSPRPGLTAANQKLAENPDLRNRRGRGRLESDSGNEN